MKTKLTALATSQGILQITFVETQQTKEGVLSDIYTFDDGSTKDLAIVNVAKGYKIPLQRILKGTKTIEGERQRHAHCYCTRQIKKDIHVYR